MLCFLFQIYVLDSAISDTALAEERTRLEKCLGASELRGLPLLVLCNKQDLPGAVSVSQVQQHILWNV